MATAERYQPRDSRHLVVLDGLRGLAVLIVLASHFSSTGLLVRPGLHGVGKSGVYLFFVLSAFLLTRNLLGRPEQLLRQPRLWADYAFRRVLRIWPLYLVVLLASWWFTSQGWPGLYPMSTESLWQHLALREGVSVLWSIPVEFTFYLWLPLLAGLMCWLSSKNWHPLWQAWVAVLLVVAVLRVWPPAQAIENDTRLGPYMAVFLCGVFAAQADHWLQRRPQVAWLWSMVAFAVALAWSLAIPALWCMLQGKPFEATVSRNWFCFFGLIWALLLLSLLHGPSWLKRIFSWPGLVWTGRISFSLYLWHMPVIWTVGHFFPLSTLPAGSGIVVFALCVALATLSYWLVERPLARLRLR